jgi:hypothetical protein
VPSRHSSSHIVAVSQPSTICPTRARVSLISSKYSTWYRSTFKPYRHDLTVPLCIHHVLPSSLCVSIMFYHPREYHLRSCRRSIQFESSYPNRGCCPRHWNLRKFFLLSEHPLEWLDQEDWVRKCNTSRVIKHNPILQGAMSPMHRRKSGMGDLEVFLLSTVLLSFLIHGQCVFQYFFCPLLQKSRDEISFKGGGGYNTSWYGSPNYLLVTLIRSLIKHQVPWLIKFWPNGRIQFNFQIETFKSKSMNS